jgi:hypothetical protein
LSSSSTCLEVIIPAPPKRSASSFFSSYLGVYSLSSAPCCCLIFSLRTRFLAFAYYYFFSFLTIFSLSWAPAMCFQGSWLYRSRSVSSKNETTSSSSKLSRSYSSHLSLKTLATFLAKRAKSLSFLRTCVLALSSWLLLASRASAYNWTYFRSTLRIGFNRCSYSDRCGPVALSWDRWATLSSQIQSPAYQLSPLL